jgi:hypothetical protein
MRTTTHASLSARVSRRYRITRKEAVTQRRLIWINEAGHNVADLVFGIPVEYVCIRPWRSLGGTSTAARWPCPITPTSSAS